MKNTHLPKKDTITLYDSDGEAVEYHPIDAREALASGKWYAVNPKAPKEKPAPKAEPNAPAEPTIDDRASAEIKHLRGVQEALSLKNMASLQSMARDAKEAGSDIPENYKSLKKGELVDALIKAGIE